MATFYGTIWNLPRNLHTYAAAKEIYETTKPVKGTTTRPFGARRDWRKYSIEATQVNGRDVVRVHLYPFYTQQPLLTYHQDDTIVITPSHGCGATGNQMIERVLGISAHGQRKSVRLRINDQAHLLDPRKGDSISVRATAGGWEVLGKKEYYDWRIDRKGANNVRSIYKEFADYLRAFVDSRIVARSPEGHAVMRTYATEYAEHFPEMVRMVMEPLEPPQPGYRRIRRDLPVYIRESDEFNVSYFMYGNRHRYEGKVDESLRSVVLPPKQVVHDRTDARYTEAVGEFMLLVMANDATKWLKAALLMCSVTGSHWRDRDEYVLLDPSVIYLPVGVGKDPCKYFDEVILKFHNEEVFKRVKLPEGQVPTHKYDAWVFKPEV